jgi:hypothetical protein
MAVIYKIEVKEEITKCKRHFGARHRLQGNIKMDLTEVKCGGK